MLSVMIHWIDWASYWMRYAESVAPLESWYMSERRWAWRKSRVAETKNRAFPLCIRSAPSLTSSRSPVNSATAIARPTARTSTVASERVAASGSNASRKPGSGRVPMALSTAIFNGSGVSSARGLDSRLTNKRMPMWGQ